MSSELIIQTEDLTKVYGNVTVVDQLNLNLKRGEYRGLLGPNGAGKSTTLKMITGLVRATSGSVFVNGIDAQKNHGSAMNNVGCVIETSEYYERWTPHDVLNYVAKLHKVDKAETLAREKVLFEDLRIWEFRKEKISTFSKGMKQRVSLAQALFTDPELLIMDEPTSGLDPRGMVEFREMFTDLKRFDVSMLISTHMLQEASELCDTVTMIRGGKTYAEGRVDDLIRSFKERLSQETKIDIRTYEDLNKDFIQSVNSLRGVTKVVYKTANRLEVSMTGDVRDRMDMIEHFAKNEYHVLSISDIDVDLEDLYMMLTNDQSGMEGLM